jgi:hypothetical protein
MDVHKECYPLIPLTVPIIVSEIQSNYHQNVKIHWKRMTLNKSTKGRILNRVVNIVNRPPDAKLSIDKQIQLPTAI